jgi:hypothetical protein
MPWGHRPLQTHTCILDKTIAIESGIPIPTGIQGLATAHMRLELPYLSLLWYPQQ